MHRNLWPRLRNGFSNVLKPGLKSPEDECTSIKSTHAAANSIASAIPSSHRQMSMIAPRSASLSAKRSLAARAVVEERNRWWLQPVLCLKP